MAATKTELTVKKNSNFLEAENLLVEGLMLFQFIVH